MAAIVSTIVPVRAATGGVTVKWYAQALVKIALTPNYSSPFGAVKAAFGGNQNTPTHGPDASPNSGAVDFGAVLAGSAYLYKYAAHLNVYTNDNSGFNVYAEGAADFYNATDGSSQSLNQTLYYLPSANGVTQSDPNTGFSPSFPFYRTAASVSGGGSFNSAPTINYGGSYPPAISTSMNPVGDFYYDYELRVPPMATVGAYYVWIVYTVVPR
ncbi:MAG TPA: hypothetical protein VIG51_02640 [Candidatus Baltobacteraceae bacterium]|jgi:hypothetical protein